jgi:hypothetical protein
MCLGLLPQYFVRCGPTWRFNGHEMSSTNGSFDRKKEITGFDEVSEEVNGFCSFRLSRNSLKNYPNISTSILIHHLAAAADNSISPVVVYFIAHHSSDSQIAEEPSSGFVKF